LPDDFQARGLIADASEGWEQHLATGSRTCYVGFDPTADSLHVGSLLPLLALRRAQLAGHRPIVLVGGGAGLIGDPSGKSGERTLNPKDVVLDWAERLKRQVSPFLDFDRGRLSAVLADNYEWISELDVLSLLRDIGKHFAIGVMLAKESVKARLQAGISLHRIQLPSPAGLRLSLPAAPLRLHCADGRRRSVGQHHGRHRPDPPHRGARRVRAHVFPL
jgi:tyrosyl-tRNA synthetase